MIPLVLLLLVLAGAAGAGLLGVGVFSNERRQARGGLLAAASAPVILVLGVLILASLVLGVRGGSDDPESTTTRPTRGTASTLPRARLDSPSASLPVVRIQPEQEDAFSAYAPVGGLVPGAAVRVLGDGFGWTEDAHVEQCVLELGRETACGEAFPVGLDDGRADFQVAVRDDIAPGRCRAGQATCLLRLTSDSSGHTGMVQIVLVDPVSPGLVHVEPGRGLANGQMVDVSVTGFPAGATATAVLCAPPALYDARRCAPPDPASTFVVDAAGTGRTRMAVTSGRLGPEQAVCGPRRACGVQVLVGDGFVVADVAPVTFAAGPGPAYTARRLVPGILVAAGLVALALILAWRTDWARPTEAATPDLDGADLQAGADLDDLFGTDAELDERDPIPW